MAELIRNIDNRFMQDALSIKYFIAICARNSGDVIAKPGHAFVVWGKENADAGLSSQAMFGFYPKKEKDLMPVLGSDVPGKILDEALEPERLGMLIARIIIKVNKDVFDSTLADVQRWVTADYNLYSKNCISFVKSIASIMNLRNVPVDVTQFPEDYFKLFIAHVQSTYEGVWESEDLSHRFLIAITGPVANWVERAGNSTTLAKTIDGSSLSLPSELRLERPNTDDVLKFLGFDNASLRAEILAQKPESSYIVLRKTDQGLIGEWHGLLVKKLANGRLDQIVQPSKMMAKNYSFIRK